MSQRKSLFIFFRFFIKWLVAILNMVLQKTIKKSVSIADKVSSLNVVESSINSPLHRFVRAKKRINQTFDEILQYLKESRQFLIDCEISDQYDVEAKRDLEKVKIILFWPKYTYYLSNSEQWFISQFWLV